MTQQPPPGEQGGYYHSQYSQQPPYPQQPPQYPPQSPAAPYSPGPYPPQGQPQYGSPYGSPASYGEQPPYGSSQPPYGSSPYSSSAPPYGGQPGAPLGPPGAPPSKSRTGLVLGIIGAIVGVVLLAGGGWLVVNMLGDRADDVVDDLPGGNQVPAVGECITEASLTATETEVVACDAPEAAWLVLGNAGTYTETEFDVTPAEQLCADWPSTGYVLWIGEITADGTGEGEVVCLEQVE